MSNEKPILFSGEMVRAILEGRKTQTRRVVKNLLKASSVEGVYHRPDGLFIGTHLPVGVGVGITKPFPCPHGNPGDRLYVKEATWIWCKKVPNGTTKSGRTKYRYVPHGSRSVVYVADHPKKPERESYAEPDMVWRYKTARFMPRWASRITLEIVKVRVERVREISHEDALAEGCRGCRWVERSPYIIGPHTDDGELPQEEFHRLWDSINKSRGYGWDKNPWVWVIEFKRIGQGWRQ